MDMIIEFLSKYKINDEMIAVGVSGGADSLALVLWMNEELKPLGKKVIALTIDHGLREESSAEALYVAEVMQQFGIEHYILVWEGKKPVRGIEESARIARYRLLAEWCIGRGIKSLAIAHHLWDQAETFFMRLERGSGLVGLCGIMPVSEMNGLIILRPLLEYDPSDMKEYLQAKNIKWVEDPSNQNDIFLRVRVRNFIPVLKDMLGIDAERICNTMQILSRTKSYIEEQTFKFIKNNVKHWDNAGVSLSLCVFCDLHEEMCYRVLSGLIKDIGNGIYAPRSNDVQRLYKKILQEGKQFKGATLGGCEVLVFQKNIWVVPELKGCVELFKKDWEIFVIDHPQYLKTKIPYKLKLSLYKSS